MRLPYNCRFIVENCGMKSVNFVNPVQFLFLLVS
jgi:hypothetical protein